MSVITGLSGNELFCLEKKGYAPGNIVVGNSVYALGFKGSLSSGIKVMRGEINELTHLVYGARENALAIINDEAKAMGADDVVGVKTYVYQLGGGLIEFLAIGTAVKKIPGIKTESTQLPVQAIVVDKDTFYDSVNTMGPSVNVNAGVKPINKVKLVAIIIIIVIYILYFYHEVEIKLDINRSVYVPLQTLAG